MNYEGADGKFFRLASLKELFALRKKQPQARLIAGATELGLEISKRFKNFPRSFPPSPFHNFAAWRKRATCGTSAERSR
jgi:hypothetical protein